jgi:hypothetical protein
LDIGEQIAADLMCVTTGASWRRSSAVTCREPLTFEPNKMFLRELLVPQMDLSTLAAGYVNRLR